MNPVWGDDIDLDNVFVTLEDQLVPTVGLSRIVCDLCNAILILFSVTDTEYGQIFVYATMMVIGLPGEFFEQNVATGNF